MSNRLNYSNSFCGVIGDDALSWGRLIHLSDGNVTGDETHREGVGGFWEDPQLYPL